jgi:hypothetical protein
MKATIDREATADPQPMAERLAALERISATELRMTGSLCQVVPWQQLASVSIRTLLALRKSYGEAPYQDAAAPVCDRPRAFAFRSTARGQPVKLRKGRFAHQTCTALKHPTRLEALRHSARQDSRALIPSPGKRGVGLGALALGESS